MVGSPARVASLHPRSKCPQYLARWRCVRSERSSAPGRRNLFRCDIENLWSSDDRIQHSDASHKEYARIVLWTSMGPVALIRKSSPERKTRQASFGCELSGATLSIGGMPTIHRSGTLYPAPLLMSNNCWRSMRALIHLIKSREWVPSVTVLHSTFYARVLVGNGRPNNDCLKSIGHD